MADSEQHNNKDLTECGICLCTIEEPKALPCLHSYCLKCLTQWAEGKKDMVRCPICVQDFPIPRDGVKAFRTNFFINTLKERQATTRKLQSKDAVIPCTSCGDVGHKAEGYCTSCGGFICGECVGIHNKVKGLSSHKVIPFEDLQSGKVDMRSLSQKKYCKIHEGQVLWLYCETCGILICRDCTVVDHPAACHVLVNLESATTGQRKEIERLIQDCAETKEKITNACQEINKVYDHLERNATNAEANIDESFNRALTLLEHKRSCLKGEVKQAVSERKKQLDSQKDVILLQQARLQTTLEMATEVTQKGSDYDLALVYSSLKSNLTQLRDMKPKSVQKHLGEIQFKPTQDSQQGMPNLGSVSFGHRKERVGVWKLGKTFAKDGDGKLSGGRGVAIAPNRDIVVADYSDESVKVFNQTGKFKNKFKTDKSPWNVVVSTDKRVIVTNTTKPYVSVYDDKGNFKHHFTTKSPSNVSSDTQNTGHWGLALDNKNNLLVGEIHHNYISKHHADGKHITSFNVSIEPVFIAVTPQDTIIVSSGCYGGAAQILNENGTLLHHLQPPSTASWCPCGLCCTSQNEIYVAINYAGGKGIYCYSSETGDYLGCLTKVVQNPLGLALMEGEEKLVVVDTTCVKIFSLQ